LGRRDLILLTPDRVAFPILDLLAQKHWAKTIEKISVPTYFKWKPASYPLELRAYSKSGHGFCITNQGLPIDQWIGRFND